jgi:dUTP pyrophosphatase
MVNIKFAKVRPDAIIPSKLDEDMGYDIYACFDEDYIVINPHETKLIPTGIASACDPGYGFLLFERGSTGSKGIARRCGVIDSGYRDEWFVGLTNTTDRDLYISKIDKEDIIKQQIKYFENKKSTVYKSNQNDPILHNLVESAVSDAIIYPYSKAIVQAIVTEVLETSEEELSYEDLKAIPSKRGLGKLGSSGK